MDICGFIFGGLNTNPTAYSVMVFILHSLSNGRSQHPNQYLLQSQRQN